MQYDRRWVQAIAPVVSLQFHRYLWHGHRSCRGPHPRRRKIKPKGSKEEEVKICVKFVLKSLLPQVDWY
jgi:hypothetical protein